MSKKKSSKNAAGPFLGAGRKPPVVVRVEVAYEEKAALESVRQFLQLARRLKAEQSQPTRPAK